MRRQLSAQETEYVKRMMAVKLFFASAEKKPLSGGQNQIRRPCVRPVRETRQLWYAFCPDGGACVRRAERQYGQDCQAAAQYWLCSLWRHACPCDALCRGKVTGIGCCVRHAGRMAAAPVVYRGAGDGPQEDRELSRKPGEGLCEGAGARGHSTGLGAPAVLAARELPDSETLGRGRRAAGFSCRQAAVCQRAECQKPPRYAEAFGQVQINGGRCARHAEHIRRQRSAMLPTGRGRQCATGGLGAAQTAGRRRPR